MIVISESEVIVIGVPGIVIGPGIPWWRLRSGGFRGKRRWTGIGQAGFLVAPGGILSAQKETVRAKASRSSSCAISQATVCQYLKRAQAAKITWPLPEDWDEARLEGALFGPSPRRVHETQRPLPDFADLHQELQEHRHLTLQLLWEEYRENHSDGYS